MPGEKTEKATHKRKQDERKKGNVFMSREVVTVFSLLASFFALQLLSPMIFTTLEKSLTDYIARGASVDVITAGDVTGLFIGGCITFAIGAFPLLLVCVAINILATMAQTKMLFSTKAFAFKGERINPMSGLKKLFSMRSLVELLKSILKITVLLYIIYAQLKDVILGMPRLMDMTAMQGIARTGEVIMNIATQAGILFVFLAAADYLYQWWQYEKNLRMSKQEIKDEYKQMEGDPQIKGRLRSLQQQRARQRMMQNVPSADVVIRNPTHYAIAIKYEQGKNMAPLVIAKGADSLALRIVKVAEENGVYVTENRPLARALYETVDLNREIPAEHYQAIAQVLAFVYNLKKEKGKKN